jgi:hypothetical protein
LREISDIRAELDRATERRSELWRALSENRDPGDAEELERLNARIAELWDELRSVRVRDRFGPAEPILKRAEREKRLERELERDLAARRRAA